MKIHFNRRSYNFSNMGKYAGLAEYLSKIREYEFTLSFSDIEKILGFSLPKSARRLRVWWSNDLTHPQAKNGWMAAGYIVWEVDFGQEVVRFRRAHPKPKENLLREKCITTHLQTVLVERYGPLLCNVKIGERKFDFASADGKVVGEVVVIKNTKSPSSYLLTIAGHLWFLEKVDAPKKFLVFCGNRLIPTLWIKRFGHLIKNVSCYFFDGNRLTEMF